MTRTTAVRRLVNMRSILIVMGLGLVGSVAYAQAPGESAAIAPLNEPVQSTHRPDEAMGVDGGVLAGQLALGGLFGVSGAVLGGYVGYKVACGDDCGDGDVAPALMIVGSGMIAGSFAMAAGMKLVGDDGKTEGSYLGTTGGALLGGLAGFIAVAEIENNNHDGSDNAALDLTILGASWLAGGVAGYYATRSWKEPSSVKLTPLVAPQAHGGMTFGVAATF